MAGSRRREGIWICAAEGAGAVSNCGACGKEGGVCGTEDLAKVWKGCECA